MTIVLMIMSMIQFPVLCSKPDDTSHQNEAKSSPCQYKSSIFSSLHLTCVFHRNLELQVASCVHDVSPADCFHIEVDWCIAHTH